MSPRCPKFFVVAVTIAVVLFATATAMAEEAGYVLQEPETTSETQTWDRLGVESPSNSGRASLAIGQAIHGFGLGIQLCLLIECDDERQASSMSTLGMTGGLVGSLLYSSGGITSGHAAALNSGVGWGAWLSVVAGMGLLELERRPAMTAMIASQLGGMGVAYVLSQQYRPTAGDVHTINLAGIWSVAFYVLVTEAILDVNQSGTTMARGMLGASVLGAIGGGMLAAEYPMSAARVWLISAAGVLGSMAGSSAVIAFSGTDADDSTVAIGSLVGIVGGLGLGYHFTRNWDAHPAYQRSTTASLSLSPTLDGQGLTAGVNGQF